MSVDVMKKEICTQEVLTVILKCLIKQMYTTDLVLKSLYNETRTKHFHPKDRHAHTTESGMTSVY